MRDSISESRIKTLHPKARDIFKEFIEEAEEALDITLRITFAWRSAEQQKALWEQGRITPGPIVTNARPWWSFHQHGLAVDLCRMKDGKLDWSFDNSKLLPYATKRNIRWGGNFKTICDPPHFEISFGYTIRQLVDKVNQKDFIDGTKFVNI